MLGCTSSAVWIKKLTRVFDILIQITIRNRVWRSMLPISGIPADLLEHSNRNLEKGNSQDNW